MLYISRKIDANTFVVTDTDDNVGTKVSRETLKHIISKYDLPIMGCIIDSSSSDWLKINCVNAKISSDAALAKSKSLNKWDLTLNEVVGNAHFNFLFLPDGVYVYIPPEVECRTLDIDEGYELWQDERIYNVISKSRVFVYGGDGLTDATQLFHGLICQYLDLSHLNLSKVTTMNAMFGSSAIADGINFVGTNISNVRDMYDMFANSKFNQVSLSGLDTWSVRDMQHMFDGAAGDVDMSDISLEYLDVCYKMFEGFKGTVKISKKHLRHSDFKHEIETVGFQTMACNDPDKLVLHR